MPVGIPIQALPNQQFTISVDAVLYELTIKATNGVMAVSFIQNGTLIISNARAVACGPLIQERYLEAGNFLFLTANQQLPDYQQFGLTQSLFYLTQDELDAFRVPPMAASPSVPTVTAASFNPIAQLPLRFKPIGYVAA